jgi:hypothetical protein
MEQFADQIFNWMVQMMYVYYDEPHVSSFLGNAKALETVSIERSDFDRQLIVSVKEGSFIPKDPLTRYNSAMDLWNAGAIDPVSLYERLDDPDPKQMAERLIQWKTNPVALLPNQDQQALQMPPQMPQDASGTPMEQQDGSSPMSLPPIPPVPAGA